MTRQTELRLRKYVLTPSQLLRPKKLPTGEPPQQPTPKGRLPTMRPDSNATTAMLSLQRPSRHAETKKRGRQLGPRPDRMPK